MPGKIRKDVDEVVERLRKADRSMFEEEAENQRLKQEIHRLNQVQRDAFTSTSQSRTPTCFTCFNGAARAPCRPRTLPSTHPAAAPLRLTIASTSLPKWYRYPH